MVIRDIKCTPNTEILFKLIGNVYRKQWTKIQWQRGSGEKKTLADIN